MEGRIAQDAHAAVKLPDQPLKGVLRAMRGGPVPPYPQALLGHHQTEGAPAKPTMVGQTLPTALLGAAPLPDGVEECAPLGVDPPEPGRSGQAGRRPVLRRLAEAEEPGARGEAGQPGPTGARQPAMERPVAHALQGMQQSQSAHRTGPEGRRGGLGRSCSGSSTW
jgi:hypothetical protein